MIALGISVYATGSGLKHLTFVQKFSKRILHLNNSIILVSKGREIICKNENNIIFHVFASSNNEK